jgi:uncharacterized membrane protein YqhA
MAGEKPATRRLELGIERLILGSRWLQAPLYLGLLVVLAITDKLSWFGKLDAGSLKIKLASSIVAISSIHLLQRFLEANTVSNDKLYVLMAMHLTFVLSALMLTYIDRLASTKKIDSGH